MATGLLADIKTCTAGRLAAGSRNIRTPGTKPSSSGKQLQKLHPRCLRQKLATAPLGTSPVGSDAGCGGLSGSAARVLKRAVKIKRACTCRPSCKDQCLVRQDMTYCSANLLSKSLRGLSRQPSCCHGWWRPRKHGSDRRSPCLVALFGLG